MAGPTLLDARWVRQAFLVESKDLEQVDLQNRTFTSAALKFTDTTPGGNFPINPPPQFTRFCDIRAQGRYMGNQNRPGGGMGRYYSEAIDDNAQVIHMRFGVPQFNSLTQFFTSFYNGSAGLLARTGRASSLFYYLGRAAGFVVATMSWKILAVHLLGNALNFFLQMPTSKFYYLKPTMPLYWNAVTTIVNHLAVNRGIIPRVGGNTDQQKINGGYEFDSAGLQRLHDILPDIFKPGGGIDVYAMANRAQRLQHKQYKQLEALANSSGAMNNTKISAMIQQMYKTKLSDDNKPTLSGPTVNNVGDTSYLGRWLNSQISKPTDAPDGGGTEIAPDPDKKQTFWQKASDFFIAEQNDGGAFASFRVNSTGSMSESFSNSVTESQIASKINSMSSQARSSKFDFAGGNMIGGALGAALGEVKNAVQDVAVGAMDSLSISGLAVLGGAAFVDIPKHWESSSASLPRANYTVDLVSPYGNPISQLINIYIPLAMLLAAALPMSTGKQSYTSPFILELYDKGRCQTRLGMIDSLSITRGTGNLGFNNEGHAMAMQVSFSIVDMSSVLHMPITEGFSLDNMGSGISAGAVAGGVAGAATAGVGGAVVGTVAGAAAGGAGGAVVDTAKAVKNTINGIFDDDNVFTDYMAVLSGMSLPDQIYVFRKLKLNITRQLANWDSFFSASHFVAFANDTIPGRLMSAFYKGTARQ